MIEVQIPKDVSVYESPLIGPFTARQSVCVCGAAAAEYVYYLIFSTFFPDLDMNSIVGIGVLIAAPFLYMAVGKPYGMRPEVYIYYYFLPSVLGKKDRPYETKIIYDTILELEYGITEEPPKKESKSSSKPQKKGRGEVMYA